MVAVFSRPSVDEAVVGSNVVNLEQRIGLSKQSSFSVDRVNAVVLNLANVAEAVVVVIVVVVTDVVKWVEVGVGFGNVTRVGLVVVVVVVMVVVVVIVVVLRIEVVRANVVGWVVIIKAEQSAVVPL